MNNNDYISITPNTNNSDNEILIDFNNVFSSVKEDIERFSSIEEAYLHCLSQKGRVDLPYIAESSSHSVDEVIDSLKGEIFQNPSLYQEDKESGWETRDQYLSGNILNKLNEAKLANKQYPGVFKSNIRVLKNTLSKITHVNGEDIFVTIGTPWLDKKYIKQFIKEVILGEEYKRGSFKILHDEETGTWSIRDINRQYTYINGRYVVYNTKYNVNTTHVFGTDKMDAFSIIENTLNQSNIAIYDESTVYVFNEEGKRVPKKVKTKNMNETLLALEKQQKILTAFKQWLFSDPKRKEEIENEYAKRFCVNFIREYDGSFLTFPDLNKEVTLFDYQKDAVARMLLSPNTLLAHDVGSGKTYEMVAAAHEAHRMGLSHKNMIVVPNDIVTQWETVYRLMYPNANIYVVNPKDFTPMRKNNTLNDIKNNDYESIIIPYSSFDMIDISPDYIKENYEAEVEKTKKSYFDRDKATTTVKRKYSRLTNDTNKAKFFAKVGDRVEGEVYFDDLNVDRLFLDECHNYKNVPIETNIQALGINVQGSSKCYGMKMKTSYIQKKNGGKGLVFASGTPITNSISDIFNIQRYLQEGELELYRLSSFNAWIANFAEKTEKFEIDVDTNNYRMVARYSEYKNLPELAAILSNIATFHHIDEKEYLPNYHGATDISIAPRDEFTEYMKDISQRADLVRNHNPRLLRKAVEGDEDDVYDNMLTITTDGRKAALDMRLVQDDIPFDTKSKVYECASQVYKIYKKTEKERLTQLIFCDVSTPKADFNIYSELKRLLIEFGVDENDIAFVHNAKTKEKRGQLFSKVQKGTVRILLGSTSKLATGVNVQNKLVAIHHIDVPWRPSDMVQREGRILRPGNTNKEIYIYRYVCEKSFDAYSWQLLEYKQKLISSLFNNKIINRYEKDVDDTALSYAEVKALAIGDPTVKEREQLINELNKLTALSKNSIYKRSELLNRMTSIKNRLPKLKDEIEQLELDSEFVRTPSGQPSPFYREAARAEFHNRLFRRIKDHVNVVDPFNDFYEIYRGFMITDPHYESINGEDVIVVTIQRKHRNMINIGNSMKGCIARLDNYLNDGIDRLLKVKTDEYENEQTNLDAAIKEINKSDEYAERIKEIKERLQILDLQLGIKKKEGN